MNGFMKDFIITTDTTTDLPASYVNEHHLGMMSLPYTIENRLTPGNIPFRKKNSMP